MDNETAQPRRPERATETVQIKASPELLAELEGHWSPPVQIWVDRPSAQGQPWEMTVRMAQ